MKRFHVHLSVRNIDESVRFYSVLFAASPSVHKREYAKWMLEDPRVNFAISTRSGTPGIDHLGIQAETAEELAELGTRLEAAGEAVVPEAGAECCHAQSDKLWSEDPQGTRWESFHTVGSIAAYHGASGACEMSSARAVDLKAMSGKAQTSTSCCGPETPQGVCCGPVKASLKHVACKISGCATAH